MITPFCTKPEGGKTRNKTSWNEWAIQKDRLLGKDLWRRGRGVVDVCRCSMWKKYVEGICGG